MPLDNAEPTDWIKLNIGHVVPIITQYSPALFLRLVHGVKYVGHMCVCVCVCVCVFVCECNKIFSHFWFNNIIYLYIS